VSERTRGRREKERSEEVKRKRASREREGEEGKEREEDEGASERKVVISLPEYKDKYDNGRIALPAFLFI